MSSQQALLEQETYTLDSSTINFLGVAHHPDTLTMYKDVIAASIENSDAVVSEMLPMEPKWNGGINGFLGGILIDEKSHTFFNDIAYMAAYFNKPLVGIDPQNFAINIPFQITSGILNGTAIAMTINSIKAARNKTLSRRQFLKLGAAWTANAYINFHTFPFESIRRLMNGLEQTVQTDHDYGLDNQLVLDLINYRDIQASRNLNAYSRRINAQGKRNITTIYGAYHRESMMHYAQNADTFETKIKSLPIAAVNLLGDPTFREYLYDHEKYSWNLQAVGS